MPTAYRLFITGAIGGMQDYFAQSSTKKSVVAIDTLRVPLPRAAAPKYVQVLDEHGTPVDECDVQSVTLYVGDQPPRSATLGEPSQRKHVLHRSRPIWFDHTVLVF